MLQLTDVTTTASKSTQFSKTQALVTAKQLRPEHRMMAVKTYGLHNMGCS
jgi:hypothetical protein